MKRANLEMLDKIAEKISSKLGVQVVVDRGGIGIQTRLRINGHAIPGVQGTKQQCYDAALVLLEGIALAQKKQN